MQHENKNRHSNKKVSNAQDKSTKDKAPVFGLVERNGRLTLGKKEINKKIKKSTKKKK